MNLIDWFKPKQVAVASSTGERTTPTPEEEAQIQRLRVAVGQSLPVLFKKEHPNAVTPAYAKKGDAAVDLTAVSIRKHLQKYIEYDTGIAVAIPEGYVGLLFPRSSMTDTGHTMRNSVGVIDSGYRGTMKFRLTSESAYPEYKVGDRIGQLIIMPYPKIDFVEGELPESERGTSGFGSTNT